MKYIRPKKIVFLYEGFAADRESLEKDCTVLSGLVNFTSDYIFLYCLLLF